MIDIYEIFFSGKYRKYVYCIAAFNLKSLQAGTLDMDHMTPRRTDATRIRDEPAAQDSLRTGALR